MISNFIPPIAVQIIVRAINMYKPRLDALACFKLLKDHLPDMTLRKTKENKEQVIFTAQYRGRMLTVVLSCVSIEMNMVVRNDTLYLKCGSTRLAWDYVAKTLNSKGN